VGHGDRELEVILKVLADFADEKVGVFLQPASERIEVNLLELVWRFRASLFGFERPAVVSQRDDSLDRTLRHFESLR